jgi:hypothetical protein
MNPSHQVATNAYIYSTMAKGKIRMDLRTDRTKNGKAPLFLCFSYKYQRSFYFTGYNINPAGASCGSLKKGKGALAKP